jgi:cytosine/creatinine deaminase
MTGLGFAHIPNTPTWRLTNARAPLVMLSAGGIAADRERLAKVDLTIGDGRITSILPAGTDTLDGDLPVLDLDGGMILPRLVDAHTHLDKGHIWPRAANPDGSFMGALNSVDADRSANWHAEDVRTRMDFSLACAFAHGTGTIRTHLDSKGPQTAISWPVFDDMRRAWAGRMTLQAVSIYAIDMALDAPAEFRTMVRTVADHGGILGGVTYLGHAPDDRIHAALKAVFDAAESHGLDLDLHVDESADDGARTLEIIADMALARSFKGRILAGHCCALALQDEADIARIGSKLTEAGIAVVSLPMCNMYLQDRATLRTPRWRGVAPLSELARAGVQVMVASDNTRDPFYAYGDLDMVEVAREATRILHLDHGGPDWAAMVGPTPADVLSCPQAGRIIPGGPADLVLTRARSLTEFFARPQADRSVLVAGKAIDTTLPDYRVLDHLFKTPSRQTSGSAA